MNARRLPAGNLQISGGFGAAAQHHRVEFFQKLPGIHVSADVAAGAERHTLGLHEPDPALHHLFVQLHIGNAVHQQPPGGVLPFKDGDAVAPVVQLIRGGQTGGAGADHRHPLAGADGDGSGGDPPLLPALLHNGKLVVMDGNRAAVHAAGAGRLAQRRAHAARKLREIAGFQQPVQGLPPVAVVDLVVPLRNHIVQGAAGKHTAEILAGLAEGHAAVHAPGRLLRPLGSGLGNFEFLKVADPLQGLPPVVFLSGKL